MNDIESKDRILRAIHQEREYQDERWGTVWENPHELLGWHSILDFELGHMGLALEGENAEGAKRELVHIAAVAVAALEQHGLPDVVRYPEGKETI